VEPHITHEPGRFVARVGTQEATLVYERRGDLLDVQHTWTPPALRGYGLAARLTAAAFAYAREEGLRVVPTCSYTRGYVREHPELRSIIVER
jgi:predicted GNAT family acetyltransferase